MREIKAILKGKMTLHNKFFRSINIFYILVQSKMIYDKELKCCFV